MIKLDKFVLGDNEGELVIRGQMARVSKIERGNNIASSL